MDIISDGKKFLKSLGFDHNKPIRNANFSNIFLVGIVFDGIDFQNCNFNNSDLSYATFNNCNLYKCTFENAMLYVTRINNSVLIRANFSGSYLYGAQIKNVESTLAIFDYLNFESVFRQTRVGNENIQKIYTFNSPCAVYTLARHSYSCNGETIIYRKFKRGERWLRKAETYNIIKRLLKEGGYVERSSKFYYLERQSRRKTIKHFGKKFIEFIFEITCGYGERPWRSATCLLLVWIGFAFVYPVLPEIKSNTNIAICKEVLNWTDCTDITSSLEMICNSLYFSATTMTTLGYGDGVPSGILARVVVVLQTFIGMLFFALFVATLTRRVIRD